MTISQCTNMDWALEELLQDHTHLNHGSNPELLKEDYIEALHQLLEADTECSKGEPPTTLPPPLEQPRPQEVEDLPPLSPPEGYRDPEYEEDEHIGSMTDAPTCPGDKQGLDRHLLLLPEEQESRPGANFPYHYRDEARFPWFQRCTTDLQSEKKNFQHDLAEEQNLESSTNQTVNSSPILTSLLAAEPSLRQKHLTFPGSVEHDSGVESIDSFSPPGLDSTPLSSPAHGLEQLTGPSPNNTGAQQETSILTSLLKAPSKETSRFSPLMLSTLLTCSTKAERPVNELTKIDVLAIDPLDQTLVKQGTAQEVKVESAMDVTIQTGDKEVSLAEFLDGCAQVVNGYTTSEVIRSTLEDFTVAETLEPAAKTFKLNPLLSPPGPSVKHDDFEFMYQSSEKVVPEWDTDLNLRLKQLDNVLATAKNTASTTDEEVDIKDKRYTCSLCPAKFNSCAARNSHRRKIHERFHLCRDCDMAFPSAQKLERHMKTHTGIKEFKCHTCGKEFMIERNLILHYKLHLGQKDFVCSICNRTYFTKSGLQAHIRQLHAPPSSKDQLNHSGFSCKHCQEKFPTRYDLMIHRKMAHAGVMYGEKCPQCTMSFKTLTELKRHAISYHSNRPFSCPHCPHKSKTKDKLDRHLLSHSVPRESFQCQHCEKKFVFKNSLKKHLEKKRCEALKPPKTPRPIFSDVDLLA